VKIAEALKIIRDARAETPTHNVLLACGFTPLHAQTLLRAHLVQRLGGQRGEVGSGLYGDLCGTVESAAAKELHGLAVLVEWPDLDGRLSYRSGGRWSELAMEDVLRTAAQTLARLREGIRAAAGRMRVSLSGPTLPLPPLFSTAGWQRGEAEARLEVLAAEFLADMAAERGIGVVKTQRLWQQSAPAAALDVKPDVLVGFPYTVPHADALAEMHARLLTPAPPLKAVITDLDDTLWHGIAGEVGPEGVSWDLPSHHQMHGLYQNLLSSLAAQGILIGVASKNDAAVVKKAFERKDLLLRREQVFPVEAHWEPKSRSVARILQAWNIGADAVIFIDDSPMELAEVAAAHPGIRTMLFPKADPAACLELLHTIRDLCGKERVSAEDGLRAESLRRNVRVPAGGGDRNGHRCGGVSQRRRCSGGVRLCAFARGRARAGSRQQDQPVQSKRDPARRSGMANADEPPGCGAGCHQLPRPVRAARQDCGARREPGRQRAAREDVGDELPGVLAADRTPDARAAVCAVRRGGTPVRVYGNGKERPFAGVSGGTGR